VDCGIVHNLAAAPHLQLWPTGIRTPWIRWEASRSSCCWRWVRGTPGEMRRWRRR